MKFCNNCGEKLKEGEVYCSKCGKNQKERVITNNDKEGLGTASMVIGIISLVLALTVNVIAFPIALVGLILGIVSKAQNGKKISGIILNIIAMVVGVIVFIGLIVLFILFALLVDSDYDNYDDYGHYAPREEEKEEVIGTWNCKSVEKVLNNDYGLTLTLDNDRKFTIGEYNNTDKNYVKGVYYFEDDDLNSFIGTNKIHAIGLNSLEKYEDGNLVKKTDDSDVEYHMIIAKTKGKYHTVLTDDKSDKIYYCNK